MMKLNLKLVQASQFFQQFKLEVCHKLEKEYVILNALSRLLSTNIALINPHHLELDTLSI